MRKKVIIIGAGISGISAAIELTKNGVDAILLETKNNVGGRFYSLIDKTTGEVIDNGQHIFVGAYKYFFRILENLGTKHLLKVQKSLYVLFYDTNGKKSILDTSLLPGKAGLAAGLLRLQNISMKSKCRAVLFVLKVIKNKIYYQDKDSALDILIRYRQDYDIINRFWKPMAIAALNNDIESAPANLFIEILKKAFFSDKENSRIYLSRTGLSELINPIDTWLSERGGKILYNNSVVNAISNDWKILSVQTKGSERHSADAFISTVQFNTLEKIFPGLDVVNNFTLDSPLRFSSIISIYCWFDKDFIEDDFAALLDTRIQWVFNKRKIMIENENTIEKYPCHISLTISAANDIASLSQEELIKIVIKELHTLFPLSREARLLHYKIIKDKSATLKITPEVEKMRPKTITHYKNLFLAGDWTATGLPATIEGAALSGFNAARETINYLKTTN